MRNVVHLYAEIVAVLYDGEPRVQEWMALLDERGFAFEPVIQSSPELDAA